MSEYERAYQASKELLNAGIKPTPTRLNDKLGLTHTNTVNGVKAKARRAAFMDAGWTYNWKNNRWEKP